MAAREKLNSFKQHIENYANSRDFPAKDATSRLSPYLKNGTLTAAQIIYTFDLQHFTKKETGKEIFFNELIWREFYYHLLYRYPDVEKQAFKEHYQNLKWENDLEFFNKWKTGTTRTPPVDPGV